MLPNLQRIRFALALALVVGSLSQARAQEGAEELYARTLRGTALILTPTDAHLRAEPSAHTTVRR